MNARARILKSHPLLSLLPQAAVNSLVARSPISEHPKGELICLENDPCEALYLLLSGRCESFRTLSGGREITLGILHPGQTFGDRDLLFQGHYQSSVRVITRSVLLRIDGEEVRRLLSQKTVKKGSSFTSFWGRRDVSDKTLQSRLGRIVTLACLSEGIPDQIIIDNLSLSLRQVTGESVLRVQLVSEPGHLSLKEWARVQNGVGQGFPFADYIPKSVDGISRLALSVAGEPDEASCVASLLSHLGRHFRYVLLHVDLKRLAVPPVIECMIQSDSTYLLLQQSPANLCDFDLLLRDIRARSHDNCPDVRPVVYLAEGERTHSFNEMIRAIENPACPADKAGRGRFDCHRGLRYLDERASRFNQDIRRLAREIGRCRVGLALSSGGARGLSHIGVIQVLEENGIEVDVIAGCSMGAYVAAVWAAGFDGRHMEKLAREIDGPRTFWHLLDIAFPPRRGFIYGRRLKEHLKRSIGGAHFSEMIRPLRIVATHLDSLERVVFSNGEVASAVHASSAIPGVCAPVSIDAEEYIDGGIVDPLPVDVLQEMGIERIIAVDTNAPPEEMRRWLEKERETNRGLRPRFNPLRWLNQRLNYFARGNILDIIMRAVHGAQVRVAHEAGRRADLVLRPLAQTAHGYEFYHPDKHIALGRKVAEEHIEEIKALVNSKGAMTYESEPSQTELAAVA